MDISMLELAIYAGYFLIVAPPLYMYDKISRLHRKRARRVMAKIRLSPEQEAKRQVREDLNSRHPFMRLPGELRNRIYSLGMVSATVIDPVWGSLRGLKQTDEDEFGLTTIDPTISSGYLSGLYPEHRYESSEMTIARMGNMSQVCRAWRVEALKHFYGSNLFKLPIGKHLHERQKPETGGYLTWPFWILWSWRQTVVGPAGRFALRYYYTHGLRKRPIEAFAVLRLVLHDYRRCPHFIPQHRAQTQQGSCMIMVDFERSNLRAVRGEGSHRDSFNLWDCNICWAQFVANITRLNQNEEMVQLFVESYAKMHADRLIRVVDGIIRILEDEYER